MDFDPKALGNQYLLHSKHKAQRINSEDPTRLAGNASPEVPNQEPSADPVAHSSRDSVTEHTSVHSSRKQRVPTGKLKVFDEAMRHKEEIGKILRESESKSKVL